jgi:hypothetical protein
VLLAAGGALLTMPTTHATEWVERSKLVVADGQPDDRFGLSVSMSGTTALVGSTSSAYLFEYTASGWVERTRLAPVGLGTLRSAMALEGDVALLGAPLNADCGTDAGAVYVYERDGTTWSHFATLHASDAEDNDQFGRSVAISGNTVVVGTSAHTPGSGTAYVFERGESGWAQTAMLTVPSDWGWDQEVAVSGDTIAVSAPWDGYEQGHVWVFERDNGTWEQVAMFSGSDFLWEKLGKALAIDGTRLVAGTYHGDPGWEAGCAYFYERDSEGWRQVSRVTDPEAADQAMFGTAASLCGGTTLIGARYDDVLGELSGSAYLIADNGVGWEIAQKLSASDGGPGAWFGCDVALENDMALIGALGEDGYTGAIYVFRPVPEPGSLLLFVLTLPILWRRARKSH